MRKKFRSFEDALNFVENGKQALTSRNLELRATLGFDENNPPQSKLNFYIQPRSDSFDSNKDTESDSDDPSGSAFPSSYEELVRMREAASTDNASANTETKAEQKQESEQEAKDQYADINSLSLGPGFFLDLEASEESEEERLERQIQEEQQQIEQIDNKQRRIISKKKQLNIITQRRRDRQANHRKTV